MIRQPITFVILLLVTLSCIASAQTEWTRVLIPTNEGMVDLHPRDALRCFLQTEDTGYFTTDGGAQWQPVLQIRAGKRLLHINPDGLGVLFSAGVIYCTSDHGGGWDSVTVAIDTLLTTGNHTVSGIAALQTDSYLFLVDGMLHECTGDFSMLQDVSTPLSDIVSLTVADAATWAVTNIDQAAITTDGGATWQTRSTPGPADMLALSPAGAAMLGFNRTYENSDPVYTLDGGVTWQGIDWLDEAEQIAWPRIPETGAPSEPYLDVAAAYASSSDGFLYSYPLDDTEQAVLYHLGSQGSPMRWLGHIHRIDAMYPVSGKYAWALRNRADESQTLSTVWRVRDLREDLPTLRARDISTDLRPAAHVAISEGRAASWTEARVARSSAVSTWMWVIVDNLISPQRSLIDTTVATGGAYRYRADFLFADGSRSTAYSDTVSVQSGTAIDMRDFLLPPAHAYLHYVDSVFSGVDDVYIGTRKLTYEYVETVALPPFSIEHAYRKIHHGVTGATDTSFAAIVELSSDPPAILVRDTTGYGWQPLAQRDSLTGGYYETHTWIDARSSLPWLNRRFVPPDVYVDDEQRQRLWILEFYPAANTVSTELFAMRGVGIVLGMSSWHILHARGSERMHLQSVTAVEAVADETDFRIASPWPQPAVSTIVHIALQLDHAQPVRMTVHDMLGREVAVLADGRYNAGRLVFRFDARGLPGGLYLVRAVSDDQVRVRKMLLE